MAMFIMMGEYLPEGIAQISAARTNRAVALIKEEGGELKSGFVLLGAKDLVLVVDFPGVEQAMKASVALSKMLSIGFTTCPAVTIEEFDNLMGGG